MRADFRGFLCWWLGCRIDCHVGEDRPGVGCRVELEMEALN